MNLMHLMEQRLSDGHGPVRVGLIGAGKFGSMFLSQVPTSPGLEIAAIADLNPSNARAACARVGWDDARVDAVAFVEDGAELAGRDDVDVVIEATGDALAGTRHALAAIEAGKHIVMVNVEADVLCGAALAARARSAGVVYSMAYGDQPALISEMVDWARSSGLEVVAAGKGTKYLPAYNMVTPDGVWDHYGLSADAAKAAGMNPQMFNSFLDGTKSAIEMCAVANACGLSVPADGLNFPPCGVDDLAHIMRPASEGGLLEGKGLAEVVSSVERDGRPVFRDLRWGVYCVFEAPNDYTAACFAQYGLPTDSSGRYAAMYKPFHLIGLELGISVLNAALRGEPTGQTRAWNGDVACYAKRDLKVGETLDGEGGYTVWGVALPARKSEGAQALPMGLAHGAKMVRPVSARALVTLNDVEIDATHSAATLRSELTPGS